MSRRKKMIIIAVIFAVIFLLILLLIFWLLQQRRPVAPIKEVTNTNEGLNIPADLPLGATNANINVSVTQQRLESDLKAIAATFAERFGSYSNQGNFSNLESLNSIITERMKTWIDDYKESELKKNQQSDSYYGITTKVLSTKITSLEERLGRAEVTVKTQRQEAKGTTLNPRVFYQDLELQMVKVGEAWKVDLATWQ